MNNSYFGHFVTSTEFLLVPGTSPSCPARLHDVMYLGTPWDIYGATPPSDRPEVWDVSGEVINNIRECHNRRILNLMLSLLSPVTALDAGDHDRL